MNAQRVFRLTSGPNGGYLFALFPPRRMDRDSHRSTEVPSPELSQPDLPHERVGQRRSLSRLGRLARSTRGRIGAALIALAGTGATAKEADAATIMMQGELVPASEVTEQPEYALALTNDDVYYSIANADGRADAVMTWFGVQTVDGDDNDVKLDWGLDIGSDVPTTLIAPDADIDDDLYDYFLTFGNLNEQQTIRYGLAPLRDNGNTANLHDFLKRKRAVAGFGPITGDGYPQTIQEAIARTDGPVMSALYPDHVALDDAWVFRSAHTPEPSSLGLASMAVLAAGLAARNRLKSTLQTDN